VVAARAWEGAPDEEPIRDRRHYRADPDPGGGGPARSVVGVQVAACDPMQTPPSFRGEVPTAEQVLGFALGTQEVTAAESDAYVDAVDAASARVVSGTLGTTWQERPIRYALVGTPENLTPEGLGACPGGGAHAA
jgi:hypothetical protein